MGLNRGSSRLCRLGNVYSVDWTLDQLLKGGCRANLNRGTTGPVECLGAECDQGINEKARALREKSRANTRG